MVASGGAAGGSAVSKLRARKGGARGAGDGAAASFGDASGESAERARFWRSASFSAELRGGDGAAEMRGRAAAPPKNDAHVSGPAGRELARKIGAAAAAFTALSGGLKTRFGSGDAVGDCGARCSAAGEGEPRSSGGARGEGGATRAGAGGPAAGRGATKGTAVSRCRGGARPGPNIPALFGRLGTRIAAAACLPKGMGGGATEVRAAACAPTRPVVAANKFAATSTAPVAAPALVPACMAAAQGANAKRISTTDTPTAVCSRKRCPRKDASSRAAMVHAGVMK